jgi:uncharacterized protein (TIGR00255 family)
MGAKSMTGFGAAEREGKRGKVRVEVRSLNHRFLEVALNMPSYLTAREAEIRALVAERVKRARVDLFVSWELKGADRYRVRVDQALLGELHRNLEEARLALGIPGDAGMDILTRFPEAVRVEPALSAVEEEAFAEIRACLVEALDALDRTRAREGEALGRDIAARIESLAALVEAAARASEGESSRMAERLRERLAALLGDQKLDPDRLHQEVAYLADRSDVTEELVRLRTHLDRARELLKRGDEMGKPFDFLVQEMSREANTLGSKSRSPETSGHVLQMKSELEKIREQARNLE